MVKDDICYESYEYINMICDSEYNWHSFPLSDLPKYLGEFELWDYPITEIDHILENDIDVVLVRFPELCDEYGYEYRFCEIPK